MQEIISPQLDEKPKSFWQYIKSKKTQKHQEYHPFRGKDGLLYSDTNTQANILNAQIKR